MEKTIALACPPEGFALDPAPLGAVPQSEVLRPFPAINPIVIGVSLEEAVKGGVPKRVLQAKGGLEHKFNPPKASA